MKKTNKGFSMVELIIVIAIMAILAGALAPALIKYINKSRLSSDIQTGQTIAQGVQNALATEKGYDKACDTTYDNTWVSLSTIYTNANAGNDALAEEVKSTVGANQPSPKAKKCMKGTGITASGATADYYVRVNAQNNSVEVALDSAGTHLVYPTPTECLTSDDNSVTCGNNSNNNNNNNNAGN